MKKNYKILPGKPFPQGAFPNKRGVNFALFSRHARMVSLLVYNSFNSKKTILEYDFDPVYNKTGDIWHVFVEGLKEGMWYNYKVDGPGLEDLGYKFNINKTLVDPYARIIKFKYPLDKADAFMYKDNTLKQYSLTDNRNKVPRCMITEDKGFNGIRGIKRKLKDHIIYELHLRGFTKHKSSKVSAPGTFKGLVEKIPYLKDLGITAVELLPLHAFDNQAILRHNKNGEPLTQYWGYDPITFMSLHLPYASTDDPKDALQEFKYMVSELHRAEIDVFLDVVFNHTLEGNEYGPSVSFKGIDNSIYYMLDTGRTYKNYSGCGNTVNCNHPVVRDMILDTLLYWVIEMGVDGFRFDLASILARDKYGGLQTNSPLIDRISENPILRDKIIIAEAWDAGGGYQVGSFGTNRWAEWNGKFRDDIRSFVKSDHGSLSSAVERIMGSRDLYMMSSKGPENSINFITCHDGFTLEDLVSYNTKHNELNGENNKDGENNNLSWNCGIEGKTRKKTVLDLRQKQKKNFMSILMLSMGVPMILAGDEFGNTQYGNNNAYCQDNELSWLNWNDLENNKEFYNFVKELIRFRKMNPILRTNHYYTSKGATNSLIEWFGPKGKSPNWSADNFTVASYMKAENGAVKEQKHDLFIIFNMHWEEHTYYLPRIKNKKWFFVLDTAKHYPGDIVIENNTPLLNQELYIMAPRSIAVFIAKAGEDK